MNPVSHLTTALISYFQPHYLPSLVYILEKGGYSVKRFLKTYWQTQDFIEYAGQRPTPNTRNRALVLFVMVGALFQALLGLVVLVYGGLHGVAGSMPIGVALIISYPFVWAHMLALLYVFHKLVWAILNPKIAGKAWVCGVLESQVVRMRAAHQFTVIAVAGSVGKTSTKLAIAHTLEPTRRVIYQSGNFNDRLTVPLVLFGQTLPNLFNVVAWVRIFIANELAIRRKFFYDIAVLEIGTDHPGDIEQFAYLKPDISVVTAITPEHMEYFGTLDAVACEELKVCDFSKQVLVNTDDTPAIYLKKHKVLRYGIGTTGYDFSARNYKPRDLSGGDVTLHLQDKVNFTAHAHILGDQGVKILLAAAASAQLAGLSEAEIQKGLQEVKPFAGRMLTLDGVKGSTIIDDSYNASPAPVEAALDVLYGTKAPQRIAILGNMNELGEYSQHAHEEVGKYCRPDKLDLVVTIGADAEKYLAAAAKAMGCKTMSFDNPYDAGVAVREFMSDGALILVEGSENRVFAEEAIKTLLTNSADAKKLVRQSPHWMRVKRKQFSAPR